MRKIFLILISLFLIQQLNANHLTQCDIYAGHFQDPFLKSIGKGISIKDINIDKAIKICKNILKKEQQKGEVFARTIYNIARIFIKMGKKKESIKYLKESCKYKYPIGCHSLGNIYLEQHDYNSYIKYLKIACDRYNYAPSCNDLGYEYKYSNYINFRNNDKSKNYFQKSCKLGYTKACTNLVIDDTNKEKKKIIFEKGCKKNDELSCYNLAMLYIRDAKVKNNIKHGILLLSKLCDKSYQPACKWLNKNFFNLLDVVPYYDPKVDKYGYIGVESNGNSSILIPPKYDAANIFNKKYGVATACINHKCGIINYLGNWIKEPRYDAISSFKELPLVLVKNNNSYGYIDINGSEVIPPKSNISLDTFSEGLVAVLNEETKKIGFMDTKGKWKIKPIIDVTRLSVETTKFKEKKLPLWDKDSLKTLRKCGYIDTNGDIIIPYQYKSCKSFNNGIAPVKNNGFWGFIDTNGKNIINFIFEDARVFHEGFAEVKYHKKWGFIDKKGHWISKPIFEDVQPFSEKIAAVKYKGKWGFINTKAQWVIKPSFIDAKPFHNGSAAVKLPNSNLWYLIGKDGKLLNNLGFSSIKPSNGDIWSVEYFSKDGYIKSSGELLGFTKSTYEYAKDLKQVNDVLQWLFEHINNINNLPIDKFYNIKNFCDKYHNIYTKISLPYCSLLAQIYVKGYGISPNYNQALKYGKFLCNQGYSKGCLIVGYVLLKRAKTISDLLKVKNYFDKVCNNIDNEDEDDGAKACKISKKLSEEIENIRRKKAAEERRKKAAEERRRNQLEAQRYTSYNRNKSISIKYCSDDSYNGIKSCSIYANGSNVGILSIKYDSSHRGYNLMGPNGGVGEYFTTTNHLYTPKCGSKNGIYNLSNAIKYYLKCRINGSY